MYKKNMGVAVLPNITHKMEFKTETQYNLKSIRFLLLTITTMFIVIAGLMIVLGMSVYTHYHSFSFFLENVKSGTILTPSILCTLLGLFLMVVTSFGFFGSLRKSTCMVNTYALLLSTLFIVELVAVVMAFTTNADTLYNQLNIPVADYGNDPEIRAEIDMLQSTLKCCGAKSYFDYTDVEQLNNQSAVLAILYDDTIGELYSIVLPNSCCESRKFYYCAKVHQVGCEEALQMTVVQNAGVIGVLGVSVMFIQLLGIIFALLLARCIRKTKSEEGLLEWKEKEKRIMERNSVDEKEKQAENGVYIAATDSSVA